MKPFLRNALALNPADPQLEQAFAQQVSVLPGEPGEARLRALAELGGIARQQTKHATAIAYFGAAISEATDLDLPAFIVANRIRLGLSYHYANALESAAECFVQALSESREFPAAVDYQDFALQHLGKLWVEQGLWSEARLCFEQALALREAKGLNDLIASTQEALQALAKLQAKREL